MTQIRPKHNLELYSDHLDGMASVVESSDAEIADMDVDIQHPPAISPPRPSSPTGPRAASVPLVQYGYTVGCVYSAEMTSHFSPHGHPEQPARISRIWQALVHGRYTKKMKWLPIRPVRKEEALLVHSEDHWDKVQAIQCEPSSPLNR